MLLGPIVDLEIRNDKAAAVEALRNLWGHRQLETLHLEGCELTDQDLEIIRQGNTRVKYVCLRHNQLVHPWVILAEKLPAITYLDCRENRFLKLDLQYILEWQYANIEQMYLSKPLTQCACLKVIPSRAVRIGQSNLFRCVDAVREVFPKCSIQYSHSRATIPLLDGSYCDCSFLENKCLADL